ncbi:MAG: TrkH family potassium uptake protein [Candidatus Aminicenantaceae bacterium]
MAISFFAAILVGTLLLLLPISTKSGHISVIDALFTSTSAVCVTGLVVQDTPAYFTLTGQIIILVLFQLGGLGIMTFSTLFLLAAGKRISIKDKIIVQEGFYHGVPKDFKSLIKNIFYFTLIIEFVGFLSLFLRWQKDFTLTKALYYSLFHSVSAFCNAGFSLFSESLITYKGDIWINITFIFLIVLGGLGFLVLQEGKKVLPAVVKRKKIHLSLHSKLVLLISLILVVFSFVLFNLIEGNLTLKQFSGQENIISSLFQVVTPRTAGFNTVNLSSLSSATVFLLILLMFIGASPGSTGGGVKTSTLGVIFAFLKSKVTARKSINIFYRTLPLQLVTRAFKVISLALSVIFLVSFILLWSEPWASMEKILFEVFSAFSTVGLSLGITPQLSAISKIAIVLTMYTGRIGPLTLLYAFSRHRALGKFEYVEESVMIG